MRFLNIAIDADGSPSGYISWHNHFSSKSKIRTIKPSIKNERFGVQRMEMLAIYFAISDNLKTFKKMKRTRQLIIVRSDSKSTIEQLNNRTVIKDKIIQRIYTCIKRMLERISYTIVFDHLYRAENTAGKILERIIRTYSNRYRIDTFYNNKINKDVFTKNIDTISIKQCPLIE